ncbi:TetR/AcrR family transcriptional regulator [Gordonia hydrophobica]|uniref:Helix-turn-helix domain-containing protein n=1 Tax=Gordonia hydrophobica TaxID=40516 RepID=A0ABZ2U488_9ACTN|nr:TetR/AcrR family transcriptional regulator [Gordonia hydrophobica]MBM7368385.1 AcrR family transcriptional regulator [Gordonia hydrophobica]
MTDGSGPRLRTTAAPEEQEAEILAAARREFTDVGVRRASMDTVARGAGVSRSTLYRRFPNKDALLAAVGEGISMDTLERLAHAVRDLSPQDAVVEAFVECARMVSSDPLVRRLFLEEPDLTEVLVSRASRGAGAFLEAASAAIAATLRHTGATMPDDDLALVSEHFVRIALSLTQIQSRRFDVADLDSVRDYAIRLLAPLVV